ncbi:MAG: helix-turn-helix transcriptional regulator [Inquilinus sp.]|nr:helix-turn-helix transcriptional regulator [Inquilinus sp.]
MLPTGLPSAPVAAARFGRMLRQWRAARSVSQLDLALAVGASQRHLSFLESGRARPSREMALRLAQGLDMPLRERNLLLVAAGFAPVYGEEGLAGPAAAPVRQAIAFILRQQEPFPGLVIDRHWSLVASNEAAARLIGDLVDVEAFTTQICGGGPLNILLLTVHPQGLRPHIANWTELAPALGERLRREALGGVADPQLAALLSQVEALVPGLSDAATAPFAEDLPPLAALRLRRAGREQVWFSTIATLGTPLDAALQELRIELFFPADAATERSAREAAGH